MYDCLCILDMFCREYLYKRRVFLLFFCTSVSVTICNQFDTS